MFTATLFDISVTVFVFVLQEISLTLLSLYTRPKVILFSHSMVTTVKLSVINCILHVVSGKFNCKKQSYFLQMQATWVVFKSKVWSECRNGFKELCASPIGKTKQLFCSLTVNRPFNQYRGHFESSVSINSYYGMLSGELACISPLCFSLNQYLVV